MKKILLTFVAALIFSLAANAQLLWKITAPESGVAPSYLFGTHHLAPVATIDSIAGLTEALESADAVYGEIRIADMSTPEATQYIIGVSMAPADSTLSALFSPAQLDSLQMISDKYLGGLPVKTLDGLKPVMIANYIGIAQTRLAFPELADEMPIDAEIQRRALEAGKPVEGLESIEVQCKAMFGYPIIEQAEGLMDIVRNDDRSVSMARRLANAYLSGDLNAILAILESPEGGMGEEEADRMLYSRNADWLRILAGLIPAASIFIAVGAGHLPGEKGLINGLRSLGFNVEPVE